MLSSISVQCPEFLLTQAKVHKAVPTAVVNAGSEIAMASAHMATTEGLIVPTLVGNASDISAIADSIDWDLSEIIIIDKSDEIMAADASVSLARHGEVLSLMKGDVRTDQLLRAVINKKTGLRTGSRLSHVFHMTKPESDSAICITDAVINVLPNVDTKLDIARNATSLLHALGNPSPHIAVLSATEVASPSMPSSMEAAEVVRAAANNGEVPGAVVEGPYAFDNAISPEAAKKKNIEGVVAGNADVLLVPNIETGNALFKQMVYFQSAAAAGVVLGATVPIILTSRADPVAARLASTALASIYANSL